MGKIIVYISSVSGSLEVKKKQSKIEMVLQGKKISYETRDVAADEDLKSFMKNKSGQNTPPQIFNDDEWLGDYDAFENAVEGNELESFLKL
eukprot:CAMPEP_0197004300 /NCGR_PEP_ID=MMETSP1380-20130617/21207_1 /TAXON_ID=5936 /ORGANISM="Euplotes crassus, Strain CT5" /LENGTH=90 /DNA_ID=CAMNT_0042423045 /DNA_START=51 /DNA_END=323 /DNA_ORIENTATION=+